MNEISSPPPPVFVVRGHLTAASLKHLLEQRFLPDQLDLSAATHFAPSGLHGLLDLARRLERDNRRLCLHACPPALASLLTFLGFNHIADYQSSPSLHRDAL